MTKQEAIDLFDGSVRKLAEAIGVSVAAVYQWPDTVPELRSYQIRAIAAERTQK